MLSPARGLSASDLVAIADLQARTVAVDGGRLKLEWGTLTTRAGDRVEDLLWHDRDRLLGFLGMYEFGSETVEFAGMVDPAARRHGIGAALVAAGLELARERGYQRVLLVTPRQSAGGQALARSLDAGLDHSEHALVLTGPPSADSTEAVVHLRPATDADTYAVDDVLARAFDQPRASTTGQLHTDTVRTIVIESRVSESRIIDSPAAESPPVGSALAIVGTMRVIFDPTAAIDPDLAGVYGFAVDPSCQGRGVGRAALRQACRQLRERGARRIGLEVAVDNERALGLYTDVGFQRVATEDYFALEL